MDNYDFGRIFESLEFQNFARDMLQVREGVMFETFADGKDKGIDGRYTNEMGDVTIFQAKRHKTVTTAMLKKEKCRIDELVNEGKSVDRYILILACELSVEKKEQIVLLFSPYIRNTEDIICGRDLNNYLSLVDGPYKKIEKKYMKLWVQNTETLEHILSKVIVEAVNAPLMQFSKTQLDIAVKELEIFVETRIYSESLEYLKRNKVLFISGDPGVGKTTLARQLALYFLAYFEFDHFFFVTSVEELLVAYAQKGKKIVVFDDFWGSNTFKGLGFNSEERKLATMIKEIRRQFDCYLILTTRGYVLEQGLKQNSEMRGLIESAKLECKITQYSDVDKLRIYHGHLRHAELTWLQMLALSELAHDVMASENYNPRVLEMFFKNEVQKFLDPEGCYDALLHYLDRPNDFLSDIYGGLSLEAQFVYQFMSIIPLPAEVRLLEMAYDDMIVQRADTSRIWKSFKEVMIELEKSIVRTDSLGMRILVTFQNPSMKDFIVEVIENASSFDFQVLINSCQYFSQCMDLLEIIEYNQTKADRYYGLLMEKAIELVDSDCINFWDTHGHLIVHHKGYDKLRVAFRSEQDYYEIGFGRQIKIIASYRKNWCSSSHLQIEKMFHALLNSMEKYPESWLKEDLNRFSIVALNVLKQGLMDSPERLLELYIECLMRNRMRLDMTVLAFSNAYEMFKTAYIKQNTEKISDYLMRYYDLELAVAAFGEDEDEFSDVMWCLERDLKTFDLELSDAFETTIQKYKRWHESHFDFEIDEDELEETGSRDYQEQSKAEVMANFEEDYIGSMTLTDIDGFDGFQHWISSNDIKQEYLLRFSKLIQGYLDYTHFGLMETEESLAFLMAVISQNDELPKGYLEYIRYVFSYIEQKSQMGIEALLNLFLNLEISWDYWEQGVDAVWSKSELISIYVENCNAQMQVERFEKEILLDMVQAKILVNNETWYRLPSDKLIVYALLYQISLLSTESLRTYFNAVCALHSRKERQKLSIPLLEQMIEWTEKLVLPSYEMEHFYVRTLYEFSPCLMKSHLLWPLAKELYEDVYSDSLDEIVENLVEEIELIFDVEDDGEVVLKGWAGLAYFCLTDYLELEQLPDQWIENVLPERLDDEQLLLLEKSKVGREEMKLTLLAEKGLLKPLGIYDRLVEIWRDLEKAVLESEGQNEKS